MKAIDNSLVVDALCGNCSCNAFQPSVNYTIGTNNVVFTQNSTFDAGDSLKRLRCEVFDQNGAMRSIIMSGAGTGATAGTVTLASQVITAVALTAGGAGYTVAPRVRVTGGGGTGAIVIATINSLGAVTGFVVVNGGSGYSSAPTIAVVTNEAEVNCIGLDMSKITLKAFIVSNGGCKADLSLPNVTPIPNTSGTLGNKNEQGDNNESGNN
jgi:hypothetical protein